MPPAAPPPRISSPTGMRKSECPTLAELREKQLLPSSVLDYLGRPEHALMLDKIWDRVILPYSDPRKLTVAKLLHRYKDEPLTEESFEEELVVLSIMTILNLDERMSFDLARTDTRIRAFSILFVTKIDVKETSYSFPILMDRYNNAVVERFGNPTSFDHREGFLKSYLRLRKKLPAFLNVDPFMIKPYSLREKRSYEEMEDFAKHFMERMQEDPEQGDIHLGEALIQLLNETHRKLIDYICLRTNIDEEVVPLQVNDDERDYQQPVFNAGARANALTIMNSVQEEMLDFDTEAMLVDHSEQDGTNQQLDRITALLTEQRL